MTKQTINIGYRPNDGQGDTLRVAFEKINENFDEVYNEFDNVYATFGTAGPSVIDYSVIYDTLDNMNVVTESVYTTTNTVYDTVNALSVTVNTDIQSVNSYIDFQVSFVGESANSYTDSRILAISDIANSYIANEITAIAVAANAYTDSEISASVSATDYLMDVKVGAGNSYSYTVGVSSNNWSNTIAISANSYTNTISASDKSYTNSTVSLANTWANTVAVIANNYANTLSTSDRSYTNTVSASDKSYTNTVVSSANSWSNTLVTGGTTNAVFNTVTANNIVSNRFIKLGGTEEAISIYNSVTGTTAFDCSTGYIFYVSPTGNFTANLTNFTLDTNNATSVTMILNQGGTAYMSTNFLLIGAANLAVNWQGGTAPTGTANKKDVVTFSVLNINGSNTVIGQLVSFG